MLWLLFDLGVGYLLMVLFNNVVDVGEKVGWLCVDLDLCIEGDDLIGEVCDYGYGFDVCVVVLLGKLFGSSKSEGMGVGLVLFYVIIECFDGEMWMCLV